MTGGASRWHRLTRGTLRQGRERPVGHVPVVARWMLAAGLLLQIAWHALSPPPVATAQELPNALRLNTARVMAMGDEPVLARLMMLWLQAFDNQPGISVPFTQLDFDRVVAWLELISELEPQANYPFLSASRVYGNVTDLERKRIMLDFVHRKFSEDPARRWQWLAHAAIVAKHQMKDLPLALSYARTLTRYATGQEVTAGTPAAGAAEERPGVSGNPATPDTATPDNPEIPAIAAIPAIPAWARDMSILLLQDMGELEAAKILIGGLLESGRITDEYELRYLIGKLEELDEYGSGQF